MEFAELVDLLGNYGASFICMIYFMWYNYTEGKKHTELLSELKAFMEVIQNELNQIKEEQNKKGE